jgi:hypothetical protein
MRKLPEPIGTLPVYGSLKVRNFEFINSGCYLLVNLLRERRPEDTLESCSGNGKRGLSAPRVTVRALPLLLRRQRQFIEFRQSFSPGRVVFVENHEKTVAVSRLQ